VCERCGANLFTRWLQELRTRQEGLPQVCAQAVTGARCKASAACELCGSAPAVALCAINIINMCPFYKHSRMLSAILFSKLCGTLEPHLHGTGAHTPRLQQQGPWSH
jgi:hypothetical protein